MQAQTFATSVAMLTAGLRVTILYPAIALAPDLEAAARAKDAWAAGRG